MALTRLHFFEHRLQIRQRGIQRVDSLRLVVGLALQLLGERRLALQLSIFGSQRVGRLAQLRQLHFGVGVGVLLFQQVAAQSRQLALRRLQLGAKCARLAFQFLFASGRLTTRGG